MSEPLDTTKPFGGVINKWTVDDWGQIIGELEVDTANRSRFAGLKNFRITTTRVIKRDDPFVETRNTRYKLGEPA